MTALRKGTREYTDKQKLEAVTTYLMLGSIELTAATLRIAPRTLWLWKKTEWWNELVNEVKKEDRLIISAKLRKVLDKSWHLVEDRLENGDWFFNQKTGELQRKPVGIRDASQVAFQAAQLFDKMDREDHFVVATEQIEDKLNKLAQAFTDLANGKKLKTEDAIDVVFKELEDSEGEELALHEEREEGLQVGVSTLPQSAGTT
jgi:hypothetical protein